MLLLIMPFLLTPAYLAFKPKRTIKMSQRWHLHCIARSAFHVQALNPGPCNTVQETLRFRSEDKSVDNNSSKIVPCKR